MDSLDSLPVSRAQLKAFTDEIEITNKGIKFDYGVLNILRKKNLWFVDVMQHTER